MGRVLDVAVEHGLPRTRQGSPTSLVLTIFGDYWFERTESLPSAALVRLLGDFGVSEAASRTALSRMVKHKLLAPSRAGRNTGYALTARSVAVLQDALTRISTFGADERAWDGTWTVVAVDDRGLGRSLRDAVRSRLEWLGFARLVDGMWLSPWDHHAAAIAELRGLGVTGVTSLTAHPWNSAHGGRRPEEAWDLVELAERYRAFLTGAAMLADALEAGAVHPVDALVHRTKLTDEWLALINSDPDLPAALLPPDWPRSQAREVFVSTHEALGARAIERVTDAIGAVDPARADLVVHRSFRA